jgi:hypothetical protein
MPILCSICLREIYQMPKTANICFYCYIDKIAYRLRRRRSSHNIMMQMSLIENAIIEKEGKI